MEQSQFDNFHTGESNTHGSQRHTASRRGSQMGNFSNRGRTPWYDCLYEKSFRDNCFVFVLPRTQAGV